MTTNTTETKGDIFTRITEQIAAAIENGTGKWQMPWQAARMPKNAISGKFYRGINVLCLMDAAEQKGYTANEWATYKQWQERGAQVRKGEKATMVIFWKFVDVKASDDAHADDADGGDDETRRACFTRGYYVFNAEQVDGYTPEVRVINPEERRAACDEFFQAIGATVRMGGSRACYIPALDEIRMPHFESFVDAPSYYSTLAHEHAHWTGTDARCARDLKGRFGDESYAMEELIAELTAAFVCGHLGIASEPRKDHAEYLASWLKVLRNDKRAIFTAASKAQQAADFLIERAQPAQAVAA